MTDARAAPPDWPAEPGDYVLVWWQAQPGRVAPPRLEVEALGSRGLGEVLLLAAAGYGVVEGPLPQAATSGRRPLEP